MTGPGPSDRQACAHTRAHHPSIHMQLHTGTHTHTPYIHSRTLTPAHWTFYYVYTHTYTPSSLYHIVFHLKMKKCLLFLFKLQSLRLISSPTPPLLIFLKLWKQNFIYFGHKHVETGLNCSHQLSIFHKYHMLLICCNRGKIRFLNLTHIVMSPFF